MITRLYTLEDYKEANRRLDRSIKCSLFAINNCVPSQKTRE